MVDVIQRLILEAEVGDTQQKLKQIRKEQSELSEEIRKSSKETGRASDETRALLKQYQGLIDTERSLEKQILDTNDAYGKRRKALDDIDRFDRTSQGVALAGDVESNARAIGGAAGAFGFTGVERGVGAAAEIPAVLEALPRLGDSLRGLPSAAQEAASSLGTSVGALGALGVAAIALAAAMAFARKQAEESRKAINAQFDAIDKRNEILQESRNLTDEEIQAKLAEAEAQRDLIKQQNDTAKAVESSLNNQNLFIRGVGELSGALGAGNQAYAETDKRVRDTAASLEVANAEVEAYQEALDDNVNSTFEAAEAERTLAAERAAAILSEASQAGELATLKARVGDLTQEQIDSELESLSLRKTGLEAELAALKASGDTSEEVAKKIASLTDQLGFLGEQSDVLRSSRGSAVSEEAQKKAEDAAKEQAREQEKRLREQERAQEQAAKTQDQYTKSIEKASQAFADAQDDINLDLKDTFLDINQDLQDSLQDQQIDFNRDEQDAARDQARSLAEIRRDANREEKDAIRQRDFDAAIASRENAQTAKSDLQREAQDAARERVMDFREEQRDLARERDRGRRDALTDADRARRDAGIARDRQLRDAQNTYEQALREQQSFGQQFVSNFKQMFNEANGAVGGSSGAGSSQSGTGTSARRSPVQYMTQSSMAFVLGG